MKLLGYILGSRKGNEANRIERLAVDDPFLGEAIEGYDKVQGNHADRIAKMQSMISARSAKPKKKQFRLVRLVDYAAAAVVILVGYFALMNHESSMSLAQETNNDGAFINLYAPEDYIEEKRIELTVAQEEHPSEVIEVVETTVEITNLDEVICPIDILPLYLPRKHTDVPVSGSIVKKI